MHVPKAMKINLQCSVAAKKPMARGKISRDTCRGAQALHLNLNVNLNQNLSMPLNPNLNRWNQGAGLSEHKECQAMQIALNAFDDAVI